MNRKSSEVLLKKRKDHSRMNQKVETMPLISNKRISQNIVVSSDINTNSENGDSIISPQIRERANSKINVRKTSARVNPQKNS